MGGEVSAIANGKALSARHVQMRIDGNYVVELKKVDYDDELPQELQTNWQGVSIGVTEDKYKANCKIEIGKNEFNKIVQLAKDQDVHIYGLPNMTIDVEYENDDGENCIDTIVARMTKNSTSISDGEKYIGQSIEMLVVEPIKWNGVPAFKTDVG